MENNADCFDENCNVWNHREISISINVVFAILFKICHKCDDNQERNTVTEAWRGNTVTVTTARYFFLNLTDSPNLLPIPITN